MPIPQNRMGIAFYLHPYDKQNSYNRSFPIPLRTSKNLMRKYRLGLVAVLALLALSNSSFAQNSSTGRESKKADVNFTELAKYYDAHPLPIIRKMPFNEEEEENEKPKHRAARGADVHLLDRGNNERAAETPHTAYLPVSPAPNDSFLSTTSPGDIIPPDTHGAVDSQYCVTAINTNIRIQTRSGANVHNVGLDGFWSAILPAGTGSFDPRVHYDPYNKRWIMVTDAVNSTSMTQSTIMVAVSATSDPTGTWHMYAIPVDATGAAWMDFPNVGYNQNWIAITGNMFPNTSGGANGAVVYVFDYASIMAGTGAPYTKFSQSSSFSIAPALTYDVTEPNLFAIESWNGGAGQLKLWKISGPVASPTMTSVGFPATTTHWRGGPSSGGDFAPQLGTTNLLNIGDDRITNVIYRNHKLWCSHTAFLPASGTTTHSSIMWWQLDTLANPLQNGMVNDATAATTYAYSSIAVNANDDALIGFGVFSTAIHPSAGYALHLNSDPLDSIHPATIYRHGQATYYETFGGSRNRWGDYSGACIDPRNDTDFWTIQESSIVGTSPNWDTWWANVQFCPKPLAPVVTTTPGTLCSGDTGTYYIAPITGATTYQWTVSGTGWSGTSSSDSISLIAGTGVASVTVLAYNACGEGESTTFNITPGAPPVRPGISTITPACVGSATAVFSASAAGATAYSWEAIGTGWSGTSSSPSLSATVGTGTGSIICVASNSCGAGPADTLVVTPGIVPTAAFSIASHITTTTTNDVVTFTGTAPAGSTYTWTFGAGTATPGTGAGPQTVFWTVAGLKTLSLTVSNAGCQSTLFTDTVLVTNNTGVQELNHRNVSINIVPNPNDGSFDILFDQPVNKTVGIKLADMQGRIVYSNEFAGTNNNKLSIAAGNLPTGIYALTILVDGKPVTEKVTISR